MRVLVTGASGFVGRWLGRELEAAGHEMIAGTRASLDVTDRAILIDRLRDARPDAIVHLAAVSSATAAQEDPAHAFRVTVGGTLNLLEAARTTASEAALLIVSSSEVYGAPETLPLTETAPLTPRNPYGLSKVAQESVALAQAARGRLRLAVVRSFNHSGPGQRPDFVVPALAQRVLELRRHGGASIRAGNLDVRRDFTDVRDVVHAYRLIVEGLVDGTIGAGGEIFNLASGRAVSIRSLLDQLCRLGEIQPRIRIDPDLVRADDPPEIRGDASALRAVTGWAPTRSLETMLADLWTSIASEPDAVDEKLDR